MHEQLRSLPLQSVLQQLGVSTSWKSRKEGTEWAGGCPIHKAKNNQTSFSFDAEGRFHCFSCGAKGRGAIDLVMAVKGFRFNEAVTFLEAVSDACPSTTRMPGAKPETPAPELSQSSHPPLNAPFKGTYEKFYVHSDWLAKRGFSPETLSKFGVGQYDNPKRQSVYKGKILLPVRRWDGELVAYLARTLEPKEGEPKYVFPKGFHKGLELFGAWQLKNEASLPLRVVYLVESPFCVLKFSQLGLPAVSSFGYSVSSEQVAILARIAKGVIYLPDRDKSQAVAPFVQSLSKVCWIRNPELPAGIDDPEQLSLEQIRSLTGA